MIKHDIVLVGAGLAGLRAAIEAENKGADVAVLLKLHPVRLHSDQAQGGINAPLSEDDSWEKQDGWHSVPSEAQAFHEHASQPTRLGMFCRQPFMNKHGRTVLKSMSGLPLRWLLKTTCVRV